MIAGEEYDDDFLFLKQSQRAIFSIHSRKGEIRRALSDLKFFHGLCPVALLVAIPIRPTRRPTSYVTSPARNVKESPASPTQKRLSGCIISVTDFAMLVWDASSMPNSTPLFQGKST